MGSLADRYALEEELGRGGMGVVYRARERATGREVAVKLVVGDPSDRRSAGSAPDPELGLRLRREAELLAALRHPGIVAVHAAGEEDGRPWLATELVAGARTLDRAWAGLDRAARVALVRDVARALGHAHARGVVHRDVKPANVLVGDDGAARVVDFGLALARRVERLTQTGALLGTPHAMAPEQVESERGAVGPPTDVWALGVLLYEALTGARPFTGRSPMELAVKILTSEPTAPRALDPTITPALEAVVLRALRRPPAERHADGEAFAAALDAAARSPAARGGGTPRAALGALGVVAAVALLALASRAASPSPAPPAPPAPPPARQAPPAPDGGAEERALLDLPRAERRAAALAWLVRFPASPLAPRVRARARAEPVGLIRTGRPGTGLFLDDASFVVVDDVGGETVVDLWRLVPDAAPRGPQRLVRRPGRTIGRPALERATGVLVLALREAAERHVVEAVDLRARPPVVVVTSPPLGPRPCGLSRTPDGSYLVWCADDRVVRQWTPPGWRDVFEARAVVRALCPVDVARLVVGAGDRERLAWLQQYGPGARLSWTLEAPDAPDHVVWSPEARRLAVGTEGGDVVLLPQPRETLMTEELPLDGVEGVRLLDGGAARADLRAPRARAHAGRVVGLAFTPDGARLVSAGGAPPRSPEGAPSDLRVWDVATGAQAGPPRKLVRAGDDRGTLDVSPDGRHVLVGTGEDRERSWCVEVWALGGSE